ncbi:MAG: tetratricopeptide repeat protein [Chloroflexaceae bacterium]|nr:tetratricopeptide repeat protein [Chloroflexaceae bacterium]
MLAGRSGELDQSLALSQEAYTLFEAIGDVRGMCVAASNMGVVLLCQGASESAATWLQQSLDSALALDLPMQQAAALVNLGAALLQQGQVDDAQALLTRALAIRDPLEYVDGCVNLAYLALASVRAGHHQQADQLSAQALLALEEQQQSGVEHPQQVVFARAQILHALGREAEAQAMLQQAHQCLQRMVAALPTPQEQQHYLSAFRFNQQLLLALHQGLWPDPPQLM